MVRVMKESLLMGKRKEKESSSSLMGLLMKDNLLIIN